VRPLRYYVDTSVWNFLLEEDRPEHRAATEQFFQQFPAAGTLVISEVVLREVRQAPPARRAALEQTIKQHPVELLEVTAEAETLAHRYVAEQLIPPKKVDDALHLAIAVVQECDVVVSWNFAHMVKLTTRLGVNGINRLLGYREIEIVSPEEVMSS